MTDLVLENLSVLRGKRRVLQQTNLHLHPGEFVGLIGPNGAGKSTLLRAALGLVGAEGHSSLARLSPAVRARIAAWLPQAREIAWPMPVIDLVALAQNGRRDAPQVQAALARMDVAHLAERPATALSGGEQARVLMARALAQDTPILLADEPIAGLDPAHQIACMKLCAARAAEGRVVMASLHDLGLAARFCARIVVLDHGQIVADGAPEKVLTPDLLGRVFGIHCHIATVEGGLVLHPLESCNHLTLKEGSDAG